MNQLQEQETVEYSYPEFLLKDLQRPYVTSENFGDEWVLLATKKFTLPTFTHIHYNSMKMILTKKLLNQYTIPSNFHPIESFRLNKALEMTNVSDGFMTQVKNSEGTHINKYVYTLSIKVNSSTTCMIPTSSEDDYLQVLEAPEMRGLHLFVMRESDSPEHNGNQDMYLSYYVSKEYLKHKIEGMEEVDYYLSTYLNYRRQPLKQTYQKIKNYDSFLKLTNLEDDDTILQPIDIEQKININLYPHQRKAINWMTSIEEQIDKQVLDFTISYFSEMGIVKIDNEEYYYHPVERKLYNQGTLFQSEYYQHINLLGGILSEHDETANRLSMISFLLNKPKNPEYQGMGQNLIITNFRSVSQWRKNVDRIMGISKRIITISSQKDYQKISENIDQLTEYEFVIVSSTIINNISLETIWWNRIIVDMAHEHLTQFYLTPNDLYGNSRKIRRHGLEFADYSSNYRWVISHQPFKDGICNFEAYFQFLSANDNLIKIAYNMSHMEIRQMIKKFFYRSDLTSILNKPEHIITEKYVNMDIVQRMIYTRCKNKNDKLLQIASYITPSDFNKSIYNETFMNHKILSINALKTNFRHSLKFEKREREKQCDMLGMSSATRQEHLQKIEDIKKKLKNLDDGYFQENMNEPCCICYLPFDLVVITKCWHLICGDCFKMLISSDTYAKCPYCRTPINQGDISITRTGLDELDEYPYFKKVKKYGSKITQIVSDLKEIFEDNQNKSGKRVIVASPYPEFLKHLSMILTEEKIGRVSFDGNYSDLNSQIRTYHWSINDQVVLLPYQQIPFGLDDMIEVSHIFITSILVDKSEEEVKKIEKQILSRGKPFKKNNQIQVYKYITRGSIEEEQV